MHEESMHITLNKASRLNFFSCSLVLCCYSKVTRTLCIKKCHIEYVIFYSCSVYKIILIHSKIMALESQQVFQTWFQGPGYPRTCMVRGPLPPLCIVWGPFIHPLTPASSTMNTNTHTRPLPGEVAWLEATTCWVFEASFIVIMWCFGVGLEPDIHPYMFLTQYHSQWYRKTYQSIANKKKETWSQPQNLAIYIFILVKFSKFTYFSEKSFNYKHYW